MRMHHYSKGLLKVAEVKENFESGLKHACLLSSPIKSTGLREWSYGFSGTNIEKKK